MNRRKFLLAGLLAPFGLLLAKHFPASALKAPSPSVDSVTQQVIAAITKDLQGYVGKRATTRAMRETIESTFKELKSRQLVQGYSVEVSRAGEIAEVQTVFRPNFALNYISVDFTVSP